MLYRKPDYYDEFKCIADKCPDTCCVGWKIMIDEESLERYTTLKGEFAHRLKNSIAWSEECYKQDEAGRCVMLNETGLCAQVLSLGEESLCDTCRKYPRHTEEYDGVRELSLSLSCPVVAHLVLTKRNAVKFIDTQDDREDPLADEFEDFDYFLYAQLESVEDLLYRIIRNRDVSIDTRIRILLEHARVMQRCYDEGNIGDIYDKVQEGKKSATDTISLSEGLELLEELEILNDDWKGILEDWKVFVSEEQTYTAFKRKFYEEEVCRLNHEEGENFWEILQENLLFTLVYVWFKGAVYDGEIFAKICMAAFCVKMTEELVICCSIKEKIGLTVALYEDITRKLLREIEHSMENIMYIENKLVSRYYEAM